jgi:hypothetical protein
MKAKLIKNYYGYGYFLADETRSAIATSDNGKLSKENCDEIFGVVDVEKLAYDHSWTVQSVPEYGTTMAAYKAGFNKAMELQKDKLFTVGDMKNAIRMARRMNSSEGEFDIDALKPYSVEDFYKNSVNKYSDYEIMQSLQQPTEIEVMIVMENSRTGKIIKSESDLEWDEDGLCDRAVPKLDSEGCLILKKI